LKNKIYFYSIFFIIAFARVSGQIAYSAQVNKGLDLIYDFYFEEGEKEFSKAIQLNPSLPEAYHYTAQIHLWSFLGSKNVSELKIFNRWSDISLEKAKAMINNSPKDFRRHYLLGNIYLSKAMAEGADNSLISAFGSSKNSFSAFEKTLELKPEFSDAYRGLGLFHYAMDFIPGIFKWAVNLGGIKADREKGFRYIRYAYKKGTEDKTESAFHLAKLYTDYTAEYDSALLALKPLLSQYQRNPLFNYQAAVALIKSGRPDEAEKYLNKVISLNHPSVPIMNSLALFLKGDIYFKKNDFVKAEKYYLQFIDSAKDADYTGIANLRLAFCCLLNGHKELYEQALADAQLGNTDIFEDDFAKRKSMKMNGKEFTQDEIILIKAKNDFDCLKYGNVFQRLIQFVNSEAGAELKAEAYLLMAESALLTQKYDDAIKYIGSADKLITDNSGWALPKILFLKSLFEYKKGNFSQSAEFLDKAYEENEHDFKDEINASLNNLRKKLSKNL